MANYTVTIDMDKKCAECGKGGAVHNGLCLACTTKAVYSTKALKSAQARAVRARGIKPRPEFPPKVNAE